MIDLHIHGAFGIDVLKADEEGLDALSRKLRVRGVTAYLPTLVPVPTPDLVDAVSRLASYVASRRPGDGRGAVPLGLHFEGPFVNRARCGALHPAHFLDGSRPAECATLLSIIGELPGRSMITVAPEIPGGLALIEKLVEAGFLVAIGHTEAGSETLDAARAAGARHMTHFGNAMRPFHHRDAGPVGWGLLQEDVTVDVIADLHHLHPYMLRLVFKVKPGAVALISDAVPPAGLPDGAYEVWGERLTLNAGLVRNEAGGLAGSACLLDEAVARLVSIGIDAAVARSAAADVPRRLLGIAADGEAIPGPRPGA